MNGARREREGGDRNHNNFFRSVFCEEAFNKQKFRFILLWDEILKTRFIVFKLQIAHNNIKTVFLLLIIYEKLSRSFLLGIRNELFSHAWLLLGMFSFPSAYFIYTRHDRWFRREFLLAFTCYGSEFTS